MWRGKDITDVAFLGQRVHVLWMRLIGERAGIEISDSFERPTIFTKMRCYEEEIKEGDVLLSWWGLNLYFGTWRPCYSCPQNQLAKALWDHSNHLKTPIFTHSPNLIKILTFQWIQRHKAQHHIFLESQLFLMNACLETSQKVKLNITKKIKFTMWNQTHY